MMAAQKAAGPFAHRPAPRALLAHPQRMGCLCLRTLSVSSPSMPIDMAVTLAAEFGSVRLVVSSRPPHYCRARSHSSHNSFHWLSGRSARIFTSALQSAPHVSFDSRLDIAISYHVTCRASRAEIHVIMNPL